MSTEPVSYTHLPNDGASSSTTPMVLDVAFTASEESKEDFAPLTS